jgi:hypothetical protein
VRIYRLRGHIVAIVVKTDAGKLGKALTEAARAEPLAREIWVTTRQDGVHLWLLIEQAGDDEERRLFGLLDVLDERFPEADFQLHILNPASYTIDLHDVLPKDAVKIFARAA